MTIPQMMEHYKMLYLAIGALTLLALELTLLLARECWREIRRSSQWIARARSAARLRLRVEQWTMTSLLVDAAKSHASAASAARGYTTDPDVRAHERAHALRHDHAVRRTQLRIATLARIVRLLTPPYTDL